MPPAHSFPDDSGSAQCAAQGRHSPPSLMPVHIRETPAKSGAKRRPARPARQSCLDPPLCFRIGKGKEKRDSHSLRSACANLLGQGFQFVIRRSAKNLPSALTRSGTPKRSSLGTRHTGRVQTSRRAAAGLAANGDCVFKACRSQTQRRARPLQHGVGSHGGSVTHVELLLRIAAAVENRQRRICRRRKSFSTRSSHPPGIRSR